MAIVGFNESKLINSEIYQNYESLMKGSPLERAKKLIEISKHLTPEDIETAYIQIKQYSNSLSMNALKQYDAGKIVLLYNDNPKLSMIKLLPFITLRKGAEYITYVFMDTYVSNNKKSGKLTISPSVVHDLMLGAMISNGIKSNYAGLSSNEYLEKTLMNIYCDFFTRILNREYMLGSEKQVFDLIKYYINRFFLAKIFESSSTVEKQDLLAAAHFKNADQIALNNAKSTYDEASPNNVSELLGLIKTLLPRMQTLDLGLFLNNWITYYYPAAAAAIDNIEYLIFMIISLKNDTGVLINHNASGIVKETKNIKMFDGELLKLISR